MRTSFVSAIIVALSALSPIHAADPVDMDRRTVELKSLRWGMFICWSFSTFSGKEWTPGVKDAAFFKASGCDVDQWARTAKEAQMGYILFLAKHHDGFCLWDTKTTDRKVTSSLLKVDVLAELRKACDKHGVKLALYFSEGDWTFPQAQDGKGGKGGGINPEMKKAQLKELLTGYGPIEYIWFDHAAGDGGLSHDETTAFCKALQPGCFIGYNHGTPSGDIRLGEMGRPSALDDPSGSGFNAKHAAGYKGYRVAEFTYPILPPHKGGAMWFYSLPMHDKLCHKPEKLYRDYLGAVKFGNIFSIDVGPDYAGKLREVDVETLRKVGQMIRGEIPAPGPSNSLCIGKKNSASSVWDAHYDAAKAFDDDETTRWGAAPKSRDGWIEVDLGDPTTVSRAVIKEIAFPRTQSYVIEYRDGDAWKVLITGQTLGPEKTVEFPATRARFVRLNILKASEVPTIEEFQLFGPGK